MISCLTPPGPQVHPLPQDWPAQSGSAQSVPWLPSLLAPSEQFVSTRVVPLQTQPLPQERPVQLGSLQSVPSLPSLSRPSEQFVSTLAPPLHTQPVPQERALQSE